ncbi:hypothetical protein [Paramicrobacterium humi]|uniref:hypothetical protein n=1 Tax=Paramicrobacterium humi TaxID=640635 RepID=UPI000B81983C|nr:hypothetical protein [Microbacterium humi]
MALPDDDLTTVIKRVEAFGDRANVFVAFPDSLALIELRVGAGTGDAAIQPAHENTSMAMYVEFLELHDAPVNVSVPLSGRATAPNRPQQLARLSVRASTVE